MDIFSTSMVLLVSCACHGVIAQTRAAWRSDLFGVWCRRLPPIFPAAKARAVQDWSAAGLHRRSRHVHGESLKSMGSVCSSWPPRLMCRWPPWLHRLRLRLLAGAGGEPAAGGPRAACGSPGTAPAMRCAYGRGPGCCRGRSQPCGGPGRRTRPADGLDCPARELGAAVWLGGLPALLAD